MVDANVGERRPGPHHALLFKWLGDTDKGWRPHVAREM